MLISELANLAGESVRTIRFYESVGVLPEPLRTTNGYRNYNTHTVDQIHLVRTLQHAGLTLNEIAALVELHQTPNQSPETVARWSSDALTDLVESAQTQINTRIATCHRVRTQLQDLIRSSTEAVQHDPRNSHSGHNQR